jgi:DNA phosphorothioation-associated putative methyltransferase
MSAVCTNVNLLIGCLSSSAAGHTSYLSMLPIASADRDCSALGALSPILRVYEGCARAYLGEIDDTNIVKLHRFSGKVSYISCPDFDTSPHPPIVRTVKLSLRNLSLDCYDRTKDEHPKLLDHKERLVEADYPGQDKFARLTAQEQKHGILDESTDILSRRLWDARLEMLGFEHRGHRLVRRK